MSYTASSAYRSNASLTSLAISSAVGWGRASKLQGWFASSISGPLQAVKPQSPKKTCQPETRNCQACLQNSQRGPHPPTKPKKELFSEPTKIRSLPPPCTRALMTCLDKSSVQKATAEGLGSSPGTKVANRHQSAVLLRASCFGHPLHRPRAYYA